MRCQAIIESSSSNDGAKSYSMQRIQVRGSKRCSRGASIQIGPLCLCAVHARLAQEGLLDWYGVVAPKQDIAAVRRYPARYPQGLHGWAQGVKPTRLQDERGKTPPKALFALFDNAGELAGTYDTRDEADHDAVGPRFRPAYKVREYALVPLKQESRAKS